jgi:hypothetical protein
MSWASMRTFHGLSDTYYRHCANNGSHKKYFDNVDENYDCFYEFVNHIMRCSFAAVGEHLSHGRQVSCPCYPLFVR